MWLITESDKSIGRGPLVEEPKHLDHFQWFGWLPLGCPQLLRLASICCYYWALSTQETELLQERSWETTLSTEIKDSSKLVNWLLHFANHIWQTKLIAMFSCCAVLQTFSFFLMVVLSPSFAVQKLTYETWNFLANFLKCSWTIETVLNILEHSVSLCKALLHLQIIAIIFVPCFCTLKRECPPPPL